jgi:cobalt-zinc-cadmium efflux system outer membrane protein
MRKSALAPAIAFVLVTVASGHGFAQEMELMEQGQPMVPPVFVEGGGSEFLQINESGGFTLEDLQGMALASNPTIVQAQTQVTAAQGMALQAGLPPNPNIGYVAEQIGVNGSAGELQGGFVSQEFVRGNKLGLSRAKYCQRVQIARTNLMAQQTRVKNDVATRFFHALAAQRMVEVHQRIVETAADNVQTQEEMLNLGQLGEAEVLQAEVEHQREQLKLKRANNDLQQSWRDLMAYVGSPNMQMTPLVGQLDPTNPPLDWDSALGQLLASSPQLTAARQKIRHDQIAVKRERVEPISNVTVQATVGQNTEVGQTVAGVNVSLPLPLWNRNQGTIQQAQADLRRSHAEVHRMELQLQTELATQYRDYFSAWQHLQDYEQKMLPKSRSAVDKLEQMYKARRAPWLSVVSAKRMLLELELDQINNLLEYQTADVSIRGNLLMGGLTEPDGPMAGGHIDAVNQPR